MNEEKPTLEEPYSLMIEKEGKLLHLCCRMCNQEIITQRPKGKVTLGDFITLTTPPKTTEPWVNYIYCDEHLAQLVSILTQRKKITMKVENGDQITKN